MPMSGGCEPFTMHSALYSMLDTWIGFTAVAQDNVNTCVFIGDVSLACSA